MFNTTNNHTHYHTHHHHHYYQCEKCGHISAVPQDAGQPVLTDEPAQEENKQANELPD